SGPPRRLQKPCGPRCERYTANECGPGTFAGLQESDRGIRAKDEGHRRGHRRAAERVAELQDHVGRRGGRTTALILPQQGMPLEEIRLTPKNVTKGLDTLRDMKGLKTIGIDWGQKWPAAEFWQRYDRGEFK